MIKVVIAMTVVALKCPRKMSLSRVMRWSLLAVRLALLNRSARRSTRMKLVVGPPVMEDCYYGPGESLHNYSYDYNNVFDQGDDDAINFTPGEAEVSELGSEIVGVFMEEQLSLLSHYPAQNKTITLS